MKALDPMKQLNREEALSLYNSKVYESWSAREVAAFQLFQELLCIEFSYFHQKITEALGRPVYTHEFGLNREGLIAELMGEKSTATLEEIIALIPKEKLIIVGI